LLYLVLYVFFIFSAVKRYDALAALGAAGMVDIQNLVKWIGKLDLMTDRRLSTILDIKHKNQ